MRIYRRAALLAAALSLLLTALPGLGEARSPRWEWVRPLPQGQTVRDIAYGDGQYVAVGRGGTILTSVNGLDWKIRPNWTRTTLVGVGFGHGRYVAVGEKGTIITSGDGATWVSVPSGTEADLTDVTYGEAGFVAVTADGQALRSADGVKWLPSPTGSTQPLNEVAYGGGQYVAVGDNGAVLTSPDGAAWEQVPVFRGDQLVSVAYGQGRFVLLSYNDSIFYSEDGLTWREAPGRLSPYWQAVTYGGDRFIALGGDDLWWSADGVAWSKGASMGLSSNWAVTHGKAGFVIPDSGGGFLLTPDGQSVKATAASAAPGLLSVQFGGGLFVGTTRESLYTSPDGMTWTQRLRAPDRAPQQVLHDGARFVGLGHGRAWLSEDGAQWTDAGASLQLARGLVYGGGRYVAAGSGWAVSTDGATWKLIEAKEELSGLAFGGGVYVATARSGQIYASKDGYTWEERGAAGQELISIAYGGGRFVAVGTGGALLTSPDGFTWDSSVRSEAAFHTPGQVIYAEGQFLVGGEGAIMTSPDGLTWTERPHTFGPVTDLAFGIDRYLALSTYGAIQMLVRRGSLAGPECGARFADVPATYPACESVEALAQQAVISGYQDGLFRPEQPVTRAEFAKLVVTALGETPEPNGALPFTDSAGHWAVRLGYLQPAFRLKAITGFPDGTARPDAPLTRAQAVKIISSVRTGIGIFPPGDLAPYLDMQSDAWYSGFARLARTRRLIGPEAPTPIWDGPVFREGEPVTRAEAAILIDNLLQLAP